MIATSRSLPTSRLPRSSATKEIAAPRAVRERGACSGVAPAPARLPERGVREQSSRGGAPSNQLRGRAGLDCGSTPPARAGGAWSEAGGEPMSSGVFEPDILLPSQFFATIRRQVSRKTGECQLMAAVLDDAVTCFQKYVLARSRRERRLFEEAQEWLMRPSKAAAVGDRPTFSFEYICEVLGLDPDYLRGGLKRWRQQALLRAAASASGGLDTAPLIARAECA